MNEEYFFKLKRLYDRIVSLCLKGAFVSNDKRCFKIYEDISKQCYLLLTEVGQTSFERMKIDLKQSEEINNLSNAVFRSYYKNRKGEDVVLNKESPRVVLAEWKNTENAYSDLKRFSSEHKDNRGFMYDDVVLAFKDIIKLLQQNLSPIEISLAVKEILDTNLKEGN